MKKRAVGKKKNVGVKAVFEFDGRRVEKNLSIQAIDPGSWVELIDEENGQLWAAINRDGYGDEDGKPILCMTSFAKETANLLNEVLKSTKEVCGAQ